MKTTFNKIMLIAVYIVFSTFLFPHLMWAAQVSSPSWYDISFIELTPAENNLYDNSTNMSSNASVNNLNINFARILTGLNIAPPAGYGNLKIRFNAPAVNVNQKAFRFIKMGNSQYSMAVSLRFQHESLNAQTVESSTVYSIVAGNMGSPPTTTNLFMDITKLSPASFHRGVYHLPLQIQIIDNDGYVIADGTLQLYVHVVSNDNFVPPYTRLTLDC